jgi:DNA-binding response OmpR family regulator
MIGDTRRTVLIVDDIEDNRTLLERFLATSGYATKSCDSGRKALSIISQTKPDIVLLDWMMPELTGLETLAAIREMHDCVRLPVIMCTAIDEEVSVVSALNLGANDYITKPISLPVLRARMALHLKQQAIVDRIDSDKVKVEQRLGEQTRILLNRKESAFEPGRPDPDSSDPGLRR